MFDKNWFADEITSRYGYVKRARGCFLYTEKQVRLTDMFQEAGRAIIGWGGGKARLEFKNALERGVTGSFRTKYSNQLVKAVNQLLPEYPNVRWYNSKESLYKAVSSYFGIDFVEPLCESPVLANLSDLQVSCWMRANKISRWRPWLEDAWFSSFETIPYVLQESVSVPQTAVVVCPPFPWSVTSFVVAYSSENEERIVPSDFAPPPLLAGLTRAFYDLYAELPLRSEKDWKLYDDILLRYFERRGPYLIPKVPKERYEEFFLHCLNQHIIISPSYNYPSIIPYGADVGVFNLLKKNPFEWE